MIEKTEKDIYKEMKSEKKEMNSNCSHKNKHSEEHENNMGKHIYTC